MGPFEHAGQSAGTSGAPCGTEFGEHSRPGRQRRRPIGRMARKGHADFIQSLPHCGQRQAEVIITTQKDAVRFPKIDRRDLPILFMRVEIKIVSGANDFQDCVRKICFR